jgi:hypothetical protein
MLQSFPPFLELFLLVGMYSELLLPNKKIQMYYILGFIFSSFLKPLFRTDSTFEISLLKNNAVVVLTFWFLTKLELIMR